MRITEEEKKDILSQYNGETSDELLLHMKRHFPVHEFNLSFKDEPTKFIQIDDKSYYIEGNKKYLVNIIFNRLEDDWNHLGTPKLRKTIKKYIDGIK